MAHLERCVVIQTDEAASHVLGSSNEVFEVNKSQVQYAMRSSYNGLVIIAEDYQQREKIMQKAEMSEEFANKIIDDEERRLMY